MTGSARATIAVSLLTVAAELALALAILPAWSPDGVNPVYLLLLAGPMAFLVLLTWRRRTQPVATRLLFRVALLLAVPGVAILLYDFQQFRSALPDEQPARLHPLLVALGQWIVLLVVWGLLAIREGRVKRVTEAAEAAESPQKTP